MTDAADQTGKAWTDVFDEALERYRSVLLHARSGSDVRKREFGSGKNLISIAEDFEAPLEDFEDYMK